MEGYYSHTRFTVCSTLRHSVQMVKELKALSISVSVCSLKDS